MNTRRMTWIIRACAGCVIGNLATGRPSTAPIEAAFDEVEALHESIRNRPPFRREVVTSLPDGNLASSPQSAHTWPDALHDPMLICLSLRTPAAILWGDDCRIFHNEAYRETFSVTEPSFGRPA